MGFQGISQVKLFVSLLGKTRISNFEYKQSRLEEGVLSWKSREFFDSFFPLSGLVTWSILGSKSTNEGTGGVGLKDKRMCINVKKGRFLSGNHPVLLPKL